MREINNVGLGGSVVSTILVFESDEERKEYFGMLKQEEAYSYHIALRDEAIRYENNLRKILIQEQDSLLESELDKKGE